MDSCYDPVSHAAWPQSRPSAPPCLSACLPIFRSAIYSPTPVTSSDYLTLPVSQSVYKLLTVGAFIWAWGGEGVITEGLQS